MSHERRVFIDGELLPGATVELPPQAAHYISTVLRLKAGHQLVAVSKSSSSEFDAIVAALAPTVSIKILSKRRTKAPRSRIGTVCVALLKGDRNDLLCDYLTELGVAQIVFFQAARSIAKVAPETASKKLERWCKIAQSAAGQSGRADIPTVAIKLGLEEALRTIESQTGDTVLCCSLADDAKELKSIELGRGLVHLVIGPEGDFSPEEETLLSQADTQKLSLGPIRLRAEVAALAAVCAVNSVVGFA
ncbi:MAG: 16S rRNA (uracil(1498)-N(3))-methyltransferase [Oligoflexia bacterium]|nr:16S rRNA (uracil(1498)-N(3))-methyltransferase [Oligoflexia bacterium]